MSKQEKEDDTEFKLFVATVYAEAANSYQGANKAKPYETSSETAWKAVASVIVNRINNPYYPFITPEESLNYYNTSKMKPASIRAENDGASLNLALGWAQFASQSRGLIVNYVS